MHEGKTRAAVREAISPSLPREPPGFAGGYLFTEVLVANGDPMDAPYNSTGFGSIRLTLKMAGDVVFIPPDVKEPSFYGA